MLYFLNFFLIFRCMHLYWISNQPLQVYLLHCITEIRLAICLWIIVLLSLVNLVNHFWLQVRTFSNHVKWKIERHTLIRVLPPSLVTRYHTSAHKASWHFCGVFDYTGIKVTSRLLISVWFEISCLVDYMCTWMRDDFFTDAYRFVCRVHIHWSLADLRVAHFKVYLTSQSSCTSRLITSLNSLDDRSHDCGLSNALWYSSFKEKSPF